MNKKYIAPQITVIEIKSDDIIQTSGVSEATSPKMFDGAIGLDEREIDVFSISE